MNTRAFAAPRPSRKTSSPGALLWALGVRTTRDAEDAVSELMHRLSGEPAVVTWDLKSGLSTVTVFTRREELAALRPVLRAELDAIAECGLEVAPARISWRKVPPADWSESWKKHFKPLTIGGRLVVRPSWARTRLPPDAVELVLDPGLSFGTGQHATTHFCLREIVRLARTKPRLSLLDAGTGSGILAIAAAKLGCAPVAAFDFDPESVAIARRNARDNGVGDTVRVSLRNVARLPDRPRRPWDIVCANLTADLLDKHAERLLAQVAPGGYLLLAGILAEEFSTIERRFTALGAEPVRSRREREWRSGSFRRPESGRA